MKSILIILGVMFMGLQGMAQISAITNTGEEVVLYDDGAWQYVDPPEDTEPELNPRKFEKNASSTFQVKSKRVDMGLWLNPKKWKFSRGADNEDAEYEFELKGEDLYALMITEKVSIPMLTLKGIALENARQVAPDARITKEEYRFVNGMKLLCMQMEGTIQGIRFGYLGYYYSNEGGTVQLITYTAQNLMKQYESEIEELLNGFMEL